MKFSTRTTYGLRAMILLAGNKKKAPMPLSAIAEKENISQGYLESIFSKLSKAGLVVSEKGMSGGYRMASDPNKVSVYDIVRTLEGRMSPFHCLNEDGKIYCNKGCDCAAATVLVKVQTAISDTLKGMMLSELA